ncbi:MAG: GTPase HflX [Actinobacteria bacterium]|nr:GTPase HflX [Actinomycetota bacterium]
MKQVLLGTQMTLPDLEDSDALDVTTGEFERDERAALRRVAGFSTELQDISDAEYRQVRLERVVLVGVWTQGSLAAAEHSLAELASLAATAGSVVLEGVIQRRERPDPATYIGSGKVVELRDIVRANGADTIVCDGELSPGQLQKLERLTQVKVVDRTWLILDIFAQHARSKEGKAQVSLAQMQYMLPRLRGWGEAMSRQAGGIGTRGPGETKIETDRRRINNQMARLRRQLADMERVRQTKRHRRFEAHVPRVAIAGYTNAGKSSLMNRLTGAGVLVEDALFATLDPTTRRAETTSGRGFVVSDTVGFVRHLPHQLIEAFRSTLEEVTTADLVLHVVDASDSEPEEQISAVREVLAEVGAHDLPELIVLNKADAADPLVLARVMRTEPTAVVVSAATGIGLPLLIERIDESLPRPHVQVDVVIPYQQGSYVSLLHERGEVLQKEHTAHGTHIIAKVPQWLQSQVEPFATGGTAPGDDDVDVNAEFEAQS